MITILNRKKLLVDTSSMENARAAELLEANKIAYDMKTIRNQTTFGMTLHTSMCARVGHGAGMTFDQGIGPLVYSYVIYVRRKDYELAKKLISQK